jgi:DNA helicase II / ATP-dependent DNA helicase PcrA
MDDATHVRIAAARLLTWLAEREHRVWSEATPLEPLAAHLGLDVALFHPSARHAQTLGWLEPGENLIYLRQGLSEPVRRFTLAHEIGHALLHRADGLDALKPTGIAEAEFADQAAEDPDCAGADLDAPVDPLLAADETLRAGQAYSARTQREAEANLFAAHLLLPVDRLLPAFLKLERHDGQCDTRGLAARFGVTEDVLLQHLSSLLTAPGRESAVAPEAEGELTARAARPMVLDPSQREAAEVAAPALIVAGPGTGKTSTLVARVGFLVREQGVPANRILALTFSNKAAREMRDRLRALVGGSAGDGGGDETQTAPMPQVNTIHAFCGDLVRRYAPLVGLRPDFRLLSETDSYLMLRQVAANLALSHYQSLAAPALHFPALLAAISRAKDELAGPAEYEAAARAMFERAQTPEERETAERALEVAEVYAAYQRAIAQRGDADFGDLIRLAVRLLVEQPEVLDAVREQFHHLLVDEFQDINRAMGVLLRTLAGGDGLIWAVGDADQAIYRFRGASPANLARFSRDYPGAQVHTLKQNYRSTPAILETAAALAATLLSAAERGPLEATRKQPDRPTVTLAAAPDEAAEIAGISAAIRERLAQGRIASDQVVLCRTRRQCQRVATGLADAGIPTRLTAPLFEQDDVKDILAVVALAGEPSGAGLLRAGTFADHRFSQEDARLVLAAARARRMTPDAVLASGLDEVAGVSDEGRLGLRRLAALVRALRRAPDVSAGIASYLFHLTTLGQRLLAAILPGDERASEQAGHLAQLQALAHSFDEARRTERAVGTQAGRRTRETADWTAFLDYIRIVTILRQEPGEGAEDLLGTRRDGVRVLTVHASKGLEFPVVYLPGLADRRFPMQRRADMTPRPPGLSEDDDLERRDPSSHLAEEACLFYVALTRARDELVLSHAERYGRARYRPSPFLEPIQRRLGSKLVRMEWHTPSAAAGSFEARQQPAAPDRLVLPPQVLTGPIRPGAIETYHRCPRQYAYRYVYGLNPREAGLATLRHALHDTLRDLGSGDSHREAPTSANQTVPATRQEALALFETHWQSALRQEETRDEPNGTQVHPPAELAFVEVFHRHGRHVVGRVWDALEGQHSVEPERRASPNTVAPLAHYEHPVTVQLGTRQIEVTLDRIEYEPAPGARSGRRKATTASDAASADSRPARFVRHRLGRSSRTSPDLRTLLYVLAADHEADSPELFQHNLTTGDLERVTLNDRKLTKLHEELGHALDGMESGLYPARPDPSVCQSCPFLLICPA